MQKRMHIALGAVLAAGVLIPATATAKSQRTSQRMP